MAGRNETVSYTHLDVYKRQMEKRRKVWETAKSFVDTHQNENGMLSAEDTETYGRMETEIQELTDAINRQSKMERLDKELSKPVNEPIREQPGLGTVEKKTGRASAEYKDAMLTAFRTNFRQISNVLQEGIDSNGGYLVPDEYDSRLIDTLNEENIMRRLGTTIRTSGEHKINIAGTKPAAAWIDEGEALTFSDATFSQLSLDAHKLHVAVKVTEELLYDSAFNLENYILTQFGRALANAEEDAFLNGDGTNKPLGLFAETGGGTVSKTVAAVGADDVIDPVSYTHLDVYKRQLLPHRPAHKAGLRR